MRRFVIFGMFILAAVCAAGQEQFTLLDTVHVEEVVSYGKLNRYQSGAKIVTLPANRFFLGQDGNMEQLLSRTMPIAFKANAGGLSTIRIRGTAPDHTSINFGGINLNSLTLGHSNASNLTMYLFDNIGVQYGSASSVNGSGSIGGAIHLGLQNNWTDGFKGEARISNGSFGEQFYGTKLFVGNGKFESVTRAYYYYKKNDFKFTNPNYRDFENQVFEIEDTQRNADVKNYGFLQEFNYKFEKDRFFIFNVWAEKNWHLVQQNMQSNLSNPDKREEYQDNHIRVWTGYKNRKNPLKFEINGGYVYDNAEYNTNEQDTISTQRIIGEAFLEHDFASNASYKVGVKAIRIRPKVYAYSKTLDYEDRLDFYASYYHRLFNKLTATLNLRQGFVTDYDVPFTPSVGMNYLAVSKEKYILNFSGNIARSYRVPTFNDRFWVPGGNPDLAPERGMNYELSTKWSYCVGNTSGNISVNAFFMDVDDWILWRNGGSFWYAENVQKVESKGIEFMTDWSYTVAGVKTRSGLNYSYTSTNRVKSLNQTNAIGRQLEYVPKHLANFFTSSIYKKFDFSIDGIFKGEQFTDEEEKNILDACFLLNFAVGYKLSINNENRLGITGMLNNVLDTDYQSSWGYAMPGINYRLSITYNFK
ncbi:TonB-dependent receptor [Maribellus luteus]|uniref:TonB-dependent receptor n=1 Tax=Maribellus luteus TaxID=2305463 RepID=A0A399SZ82_9BACT|nr:TonB-dependent receptor [Maribellus luteus]RIJ47932.1 TonB-dependent receptor [Maribellus luteus]